MVIRDYLKLTNLSDTSIKSMMIYISLVTGKVEEELHNLSIDELVNLYNENNLELDSNGRNVIKIDTTPLQIIDFNTVSLGQFIDLEHYISDNWMKNIPFITAILYRLFDKQPLKEIIFEDYSTIDIKERGNIFLDTININHVYGNIMKYIKWRESIFSTYSFFDSGINDINPDELNEEELEIYYDEINNAEKSKKSMWQDILTKVSEGDITRFDKILETNVILVFNRLDNMISEFNKINKSGIIT